MYRVVISGFYGFNHIGDEAILQSILNQFGKENESLKFTVLSANPENTSGVYEVDSVDRSSFVKIYKALKASDALISGGGGLLQDVTSFFSIWYYFGVIFIAMLLGKPVYVFANGIGPVTNKFNRIVLRYIMNRVRKISVRDAKSREELLNLGVKREVDCTADPVFTLEPASVEESTSVLLKESGFGSIERPMVGFSLRKWKGDTDGISSKFAAVADRVASDMGADIVFFPFHFDSDLQMARQVAAKMKTKPVIISRKYLPSQVLGLFGLMKLNVCVRLHGLIFSSRMGVPMVAVSYDPKVDSFMNVMDMEPVSDYGHLDADAMNKAIDNMWDDLTEFSEAIRMKAEELERISKSGFREIIEDLDSLFGLKE